jgi:small subunit ribosomal protein S17e
MGRIKTQQIKRITFELIKKHRDSFKKDFEENKKIVEGFVEIRSKKLRNTIAGYVTRLMQKEEIE